MPSTNVRLVLFSHAGGNYSVVTCRRATAEHFGWLKHYPTYSDVVFSEARAGDGLVPVNRLRAMNRAGYGKQILISRNPSKRAYAPGKTHTIRINSRVTNIDLAELAHFTEAEWHWMEARNGARVDRQQWLDVYAGRGTIPRGAAAAALRPS